MACSKAADRPKMDVYTTIFIINNLVSLEKFGR